MIEINNLRFGYSKRKELFSDLNLNLKPGSIVGLLGKNGAGKSTLLKIIAGLRAIDSGEIKVLGHTPFKRLPEVLSETLLVPEEFNTPDITIKRYLKANAPFYSRFDLDRFYSILSQFELPEVAKLTRLSYGQKKKLLIAFALSTNCKLLIMDEPTNGLDIPSKSIFRRVLASSINEDQTVVISTHQVKDIEKIIDRIVFIENGKIVLNSNIMDISDRYSFRVVPTLEGVDYLYSEPTIGGFQTIERKSNSDTEVDLELMFNAIVSDNLKL